MRAPHSPAFRNGKIMANPSYKHVDEMRPWSDKEHLLECVAWTPEAPGVMTFTSSPTGRNTGSAICRRPVCHAGTSGGAGAGASHLYALVQPVAALYGGGDVKAQADSIGTRWMFDHLKPGMKIKLRPPRRFFLCEASGREILFISAGSGITPMMSMTRDMADRQPDSDIAFIHCARTPTTSFSAGNWNTRPATAAFPARLHR